MNSDSAGERGWGVPPDDSGDDCCGRSRVVVDGNTAPAPPVTGAAR